MATSLNAGPQELIEDYRHGFHDPEDAYAFKSAKGLTREIVSRISSMKDEPAWMTAFRLKAYELFRSKPMPDWADTALLDEIDFDDIHYFVKASEQQSQNWDDVPDDIKRTFDRLGIPEAVEGALDIVGHVVPVLALLLGGFDEVVDVVEVDLVEQRGVGPIRHRLGTEKLVGLEPEGGHPGRLAL